MRTDRALDLLYALQGNRPWRNIKRYAAGSFEFDHVLEVMRQFERKYPTHSFRILLMPFNVLAADTTMLTDDGQDLL